MKYVLVVIALFSAVYTFSFAKYNWRQKNKMAAVGASIIAVVSIILPIVVLFF